MSKVYYFILFLLLSVFFLYERTEMLTLDIEGAVVEEGNTTIYIGACAILSLIAISVSKKQRDKDNLYRSFCVFMIYVYIIAIIHSFFHPFGSRNQYGAILLPLLMFLAISKVEMSNKGSAFVVWMITAIIILLAYTFYTEYITTVVFSVNNRNNSSYYILYFLPFLLCHKNRIVRYISIAVISIVVLISLKRGGFVALMLALAVYLYVSEISMKGKRMKLWGLTVLAAASVIIVITVIYLNDNLLEGMLFNRMEEINETGGANRLDIYKSYLSFISNSPFDAIIFGRGWEGSIRDSNVGYTCHNDFLESFIDFGIFGLILYILLYVSLFRKFFRMVRAKHDYAPAMGASLALLCMNSMVSHILIYPWYMTTFAIFWGFIVSSTRHLAIPSKQKYIVKNENRIINLSRGL